MPGSTLVGRAAELERLVAFAAAPAAPGGRLLVVLGEAGVGKTRLIDEMVAATGDGAIVRGRADEHETAAFGLWLGVLRQLDLPRPAADPSIPAGELRWEVADLLAGAAPPLLVIDDLHWADDDALWVLEQLLDRSVAVVATTRPGSEARAARWHALYRRAEVVALDGLDPAEVAELEASLGGVGDRSLWERTGGNPLFVRELVLAGGRSVPTSINDVLGASVERLGAAVADVLSVAAVAGPDSPVAVLAAGAGVSVPEVERALDAARQADVLRDEGGTLRFRHDLLADAAARRLDGAALRRVHLALADAWPQGDSRGARHRLLAVPDADPEEAASAALAVAAGLPATDAAALLRLAGGVLDARQDVTDTTKARVALAEGEARWGLDDFDAARAACVSAARHADAAGDVALAAAAEVAAARFCDPFRPDPVRVARLAELDERLPPDHDQVDPGLRIRLRGRRAVLTRSMPELAEQSVPLAEDGLARARLLGDPEVLVTALCDRYFALSTPADFEGRAAAADEIVELARSSGRPELALLGHEWRYAARVGRGDVADAIAALDELEVLAAIMPSPYWRYSAAIRRCGVLGLLGDYEGALRIAASSTPIAKGTVSEVEAAGLEVGIRCSLGLAYGRDDHGTREPHEALVAVSDDPVLFLQAHHALTELLLGDREGARRRLVPWIDRLGTAMHAPEGLMTLSAIGQVAVSTGWHEPVPALRTMLRPFAGWLPSGNGVTLEGSVDHHLAALALLAGDLPDARAFSQSALAFARRARSPVLEARALALVADVAERSGEHAAATSARDAAHALADPLGMRIDADRGPLPAATIDDRSRAAPADTAAAHAGRDVALQLAQGRWSVDSPYGQGSVADSTGLRQLVRLVTSPGTPVAAVELAGTDGTPAMVVSSDLGAALDGRAKREYRQRITELREDIDEAVANNDVERASRHELELEAILKELRAAVGLGGRDRPRGSSAERARVNAARSIRRGIAAMTTAVPDLGAHLTASIRTGHQCVYAPEPAAALTWTVAR